MYNDFLNNTITVYSFKLFFDLEIESIFQIVILETSTLIFYIIIDFLSFIFKTFTKDNLQSE